MMETCKKEELQEQGGQCGRREKEELYQASVRLVEELKKQGFHVSIAESCTGGMIASGIVDVSGASTVFEEGYVTYSDRVKTKILDVRQETLDQYTAVSSQVAAEMAVGLQKQTGVELTIAVTGYAGPEDGEDGTPAGTVYIGTCFAGKTEVRHFLFAGDRSSCRRQAARRALEFALERIQKSE